MKYLYIIFLASSIILAKPNKPSKNSFIQSSAQAFYFMESIENIQAGDIVMCYCNDFLAGSRVWTGPHTDIPAMGNDGMEYTSNYCSEGDIPQFKIQKYL